MKFGRLAFLFSLTILFIISVISPWTGNAASSSSISVTVSPQNPAPGENVDMILSSYAYNLDSVLISWSINGKPTSAGIGKKSFSATAPEAGEQTDITATISLPDGSIEKKILLRPAVMVLLWQANDSYVPPFYRGKALPTAGSQIKVVAMPEIKSSGRVTNPKNMVYTWREDYTNKPDASGYGRNFYTYINDYLEEANTISVTASTVDQQYSSERNINIGTTTPKILFYKDDNTLGTLWDSALGDGHRVVGEEVIHAAPYFISPPELRIPTLIFDWFINDYQIAVPNYRKNLLPLRTETGTSGTSKIKLEITSTDKIFENAKGQINLEF